MGFLEIQASEVTGNFFDKIGRQWMLVGTKHKDSANLMTASWGGAGILWNKPAAFIFIRKSRLTHDILEQETGFSLTFYGDGYRSELGICGSKSGRDMDKADACGFTVAFDGDIPYTEEAELVLICRKKGMAPIGPDAILDPSIVDGFYSDNDFHDLYIGEITKVLIRE
ncbi:flavin reductase [Ruminococcaceae bacterium OttesenSCG-928-L11]|nr:flavin reductase [Ruminococcaceae bacterium OttesenSCG-928-L11]